MTGCGLPSELRTGASGLPTMENRAATIGGRLNCSSRSRPSGTLIRPDVPLDETELPHDPSCRRRRHPALRAGLRTVLDSEPGIVFAGESSGSEESVWPILRTARPDLVLLDYHLPRGDGLQRCYRIKSEALVRA